ncbi:MAG: methyl-accepting chemotaxis protein [Candidatus Omnitrophica bacterium]|nr:methyl-accepting chemotaxis protein [Candidatus Omnitrophota bacterium]
MTNAPGPKNRRRNYFIKKKFQASFIVKFCLLLILACLIMSAISLLLTKETVTTSFEGLRLIVKSTADYILPVLASSGMIAVVLVSLATIAVLLFISHRIYGPIYRLEKDVTEIGKGNLTVEVRLREHDEFKGLGEIINDMVSEISHPLSSSQARIKELEEEVGAVRSLLRSKGAPEGEIEKKLGDIEKKIGQVKNSLSYFRISPLFLFLFLFAAATAPASVISEDGRFSDGSDWTSVNSLYCTVFFKDGVNLASVNNRIDTYKIDYGLTEKPVRAGDEIKDEIAYKFDLIFSKVQEILDMRPKGLRLNVRIYKGQDDLDRVYVEIFRQDNKFIAYYIFKLNTLFASEQKVSANVLAHEIAHCVVDHYFSVIPPTKVAEMIAQYADAHLRE